MKSRMILTAWFVDRMEGKKGESVFIWVSHEVKKGFEHFLAGGRAALEVFVSFLHYTPTFAYVRHRKEISYI